MLLSLQALVQVCTSMQLFTDTKHLSFNLILVKDFLYRVIYHEKINYVLRNINYVLAPLFFNKLKIPPSGILNLKTDSGILKIKTNQTSYLTQLLFWKGYKSFEYSEIFENLIKDCQIFLDIGSNIGYYALIAAKSNPQIKTYAYLNQLLVQNII